MVGEEEKKRREAERRVHCCREQRGAPPYRAELGIKYGPAEFTESYAALLSRRLDSHTRHRMTRF